MKKLFCEDYGKKVRLCTAMARKVRLCTPEKLI